MRRLLFLLLLVGCTTQLTAQETQEPHNFRTTKALDIFNALYRDLDLYYVDTLNAEQQVEGAINYMLNRLDPYTEFYKAGRTDELRLMTTGKYAGIGSPIRYHKASDRCAFDAPYLNMPAWLAGIRSGDIIMRIDNKDVGVCGKTERREYSQKISNLLRGNPGTTFTVTVKRPGRERLLRFRITRQTIKQPSVVYSTLLPNQIGYVLLSTFTEDTAKDLHDAFDQLRKQGAKRLVFDLRNNGGGLMGEAVKVVNFFVPRHERNLQDHDFPLRHRDAACRLGELRHGLRGRDHFGQFARLRPRSDCGTTHLWKRIGANAQKPPLWQHDEVDHGQILHPFGALHSGL